MKYVVFWLTGAFFSIGLAASAGEVTEENCSSHCSMLLFGWPVYLGEYVGKLNTVTLHKQDRLSLPCPQGGE